VAGDLNPHLKDGHAPIRTWLRIPLGDLVPY